MIYRFLSLLFVLFLSFPALAMDDAPNATLDVFASHSSVQKGGEITLAVRQNIRDDWHTYWTNPGDSGEAISIEWNVPDGVNVGAIKFPTPMDIAYPPLMNYGYEGAPIYLQKLSVSDDFKGDNINLTSSVTWLVCKDICIPESQDVSILIPVSDAVGTPINNAVFDAANTTIPQQVDWQTTLKKIDGQAALSVSIPAGMHNQFTDVKIYPFDWGVMETNGSVMADMFDDKIVFTKTAGARDYNDVDDLRFVLVTDNGQSYQISANENGAVFNGENDTNANQSSYIGVLLFAFIGGLILNLMPCVFPVLSMKALSLVTLSDKERHHAQASGIAYMVGIILSFLLIAGSLIALKSAGASIGWGFQLQDPFIVAGIAVLLFAIGLNLLGFFEISGRLAGIGSNLTSGNGVKASFFTGVLATLVATPCSAPFMASAVGYALTQNAFVALSVFAMLGFGLAFPYVLLCFVPRVQAILPKPGAWMETFRHALAFPMFASVIWLVWVLVQQSGDLAVLYILGIFLSIGFILWLYKKSVPSMIKHIVLVGGVVATIFFAPLLSSTDKSGFESFTQEKLEQVLVDEPNRPVFVNMTAAWCITCLVNERTSLSQQPVKDAFAAANIIYMKGDWTNRNAEIANFLESHGRSGVPLYIYYGVADEVGARPEPILLPQILTPSIVIDVIEKGEKS